MNTNSDPITVRKHCDVIKLEELGKGSYEATVRLTSQDAEFAPPTFLLKGTPKKIYQILAALGLAYAEHALPEETMESPLNGKMTFEVKKNKIVGTSENGTTILESYLPDEGNEEEVSMLARSILHPETPVDSRKVEEKKENFPSLAALKDVEKLFLGVRTLWADLNRQRIHSEKRNGHKVVALHLFVRNLADAKGLDPTRFDEARQDPEIAKSSSLQHLLRLYRLRHFPELSEELLVLEKCSEIENRMVFTL